MVQKIKKLLKSYHVLPDKKRYAEFITALLSIPVLITVLLTNLNSLKAKDTQPVPKSEEKNIIISYVPQKDNASNSAPSPTSAVCKKGIGNVEITSPSDSEIVTDNQVSVHISTDDSYCSVVWSYRINDGKWSDYDNNSISLYNLKNGDIRFELKIKSTTNKDEKVLTRRFTYKGSDELLPTSTPTATPSSLQ